MKIFVALLFALFTLFACTTQDLRDPATLPKDISLKKDRPSRQQIEENELSNAFQEIQNQIDAIPCTDEKEWRFSPIGAKPCGGPATYIAYPIAIEEEILQKINDFTSRQNAFNKKYNLVSDCAIVPAPSGIVCENGEAILLSTAENPDL